MTQILTCIGKPRKDKAKANSFVFEIQIPGAIILSNWTFTKSCYLELNFSKIAKGISTVILSGIG